MKALEQQTLFEIVMEVGKGMALVPMLQSSLWVMVSKLGCHSGMVVRVRGENAEAISTIPLSAHAWPEFLQACQALRGESFSDALPRELALGDRKLLAFPLPGFGFLLLGKAGLPLSRSMQGGMMRIAGKLALACLACEQAEQVAAASERTQLLLDSAEEGIFGTDPQGLCTFINASALRLLGYEHMDELVGQPIHERIHHHYPDDRPYPAHECLSMPSCQNAARNHVDDEWFWRRDGSAFPVEYWSHNLTQHGRMVGKVTTFFDISQRLETEQQLRIAAIAFESQEGMFICDAAQTILQANHAFCRISGYSAEELIGKTPTLFKSGCHDDDFYRAMRESMAGRGFWQGELWNRRKNGEVFPAWLSVSAVRDSGGRMMHYVASLSDITLRKQSEDEIRRLAFYDVLTGLPNRRLLLDRLGQALLASERSGRYGALLFIDLDHFKNLNDTQGHDMGDLLLQQVASRLSACLRKRDSAARFGGDEFVVLLEDLPAQVEAAALAAETVGDKILAALNAPYDLAGLSFHSTPSIGATLFGRGNADVDELLKQADLAMYQSKSAGRNCLHFFAAEMQAVVAARVVLEQELRRGIQDGQFRIYLQPQVDMAGKMVAAELLLRWQHPLRGLLAPDSFLTLAEDTGLILPLGQWVLTQAAVLLAAWAQKPETAELVLAVNVSTREFREPDFAVQLLATLAAQGADPARLKLELSEVLLLDDIPANIERMALLQNAGIRLALDDFGTAYSSLSYLKQLPLTQFKIDRSFVHDLSRDANGYPVVRAMIALAHSLGLPVVAEGVETADQQALLQSEGCDIFQGYFISRPFPADALAAFLASHA